MIDRDPITDLREQCNKIIERLNAVPRGMSASVYHERIIDFDMLNGLLKKCDEVFKLMDMLSQKDQQHD